MGSFLQYFEDENGAKTEIDSGKSYCSNFTIIGPNGDRVFILKSEIPKIIKHLLEIDDWCDYADKWSDTK